MVLNIAILCPEYLGHNQALELRFYIACQASGSMDLSFLVDWGYLRIYTISGYNR